MQYKAQIMRTSLYTTWGPGEEWGVLNKVLYWEAQSAPRLTPLPFYIPFLTDKVPLMCIIFQETDQLVEDFI